MVIKSVQKVIKIGSSAGVTIPAKDLKRGDMKVGDEIEISLKKPTRNQTAEDKDVLDTARGLLKRYRQDFEHLAKR
jgi:antitoxin component of MazEF toxin-antitoxin module